MPKTTPTGLPDPKQSPEVDKRCKNCKWFSRRVLPPDDLGICNDAKDFTPAMWQYEDRIGCNNWWAKEEE